MLDKTLDGDPLPAGDIDLEPGGDSVEAYKDAAEGFDLRKGRLASDCDKGKESMRAPGCLILGSFAVEAAIGSAWSGSVGEASSSKGCGIKAT